MVMAALVMAQDKDSVVMMVLDFSFMTVDIVV